MPLGRPFAILAGIIVLIFLALGAGLYALDLQKTTSYRKQTLKTATESTAHRLQTLVDNFSKTVDAIARQPNIIELLERNDPQSLAKEESRLISSIPELGQLNLLPSALLSLTQTSMPDIGYADMEMARQAIESKQAAAIHAFGTPQGHIAIARVIFLKKEPIGVVLAGFSVNSITATLPGLSDGALELRQNSLRIGLTGDSQLDSKTPAGEVPVPEVSWKIRYWIPDNLTLNWQLVAALFTIGGTLCGLACLLAFHWLKHAIINDEKVVRRLVQDVLNKQAGGSYPVKLSYFRELVNKIQRLRPGTPVKKSQDSPEKESAEGENLDNELAPSSLVAKEENDVAVGSQSNEIVSTPKSIFRAYDIRGIAGKTLTMEMAYYIGAALGSEAKELNQQKIAVGRDGRLSSPELGDTLVRGLRDSGQDVIDLGVVPTPLVYFATHFLDDLRSGVMLTGGNNSSEYNGMKVILAGESVTGTGLQKIRERIKAKDFTVGKGVVESLDLAPDYIGIIGDDVQIARPIKVVLDCGNGSAGKLAPLLLKTLGCEVVEIFCEIDGSFPNHHPDPGNPGNYKALIESVKENGAELGITLDGDGDRIGIVDSDGKIIWPDRQLMLFANDVLSREPGADIIYDVKCSRNLATEIVKYGGRPLMWKTGHSLMKAKIKETGAALGGEMSGHIFFHERWYGFDDGIYAAARLLEILSIDTRNSNEVFAELPDNLNTPVLTIPITEGEGAEFIDALVALASFPDAKTTTLDGLRVDFPDGWGLVRASNSTSSLGMRFEAETQEAMDRIQGDFKKLIKKIKPNIKLPF